MVTCMRTATSACPALRAIVVSATEIRVVLSVMWAVMTAVFTLRTVIFPVVFVVPCSITIPVNSPLIHVFTVVIMAQFIVSMTTILTIQLLLVSDVIQIVSLIVCYDSPAHEAEHGDHNQG